MELVAEQEKVRIDLEKVEIERKNMQEQRLLDATQADQERHEF